jgi:glucose 1-dehydrogenase
VRPVIVDSIRTLGPGGVICLTGVGGGGPASGLSPADVAREAVLHNNVIVGSVNANRRHFYRATEAVPSADRDWLSQLIPRLVPLEHIDEALERSADGIKVVVDFGG